MYKSRTLLFVGKITFSSQSVHANRIVRRQWDKHQQKHKQLMEKSYKLFARNSLFLDWFDKEKNQFKTSFVTLFIVVNSIELFIFINN